MDPKTVRMLEKETLRSYRRCHLSRGTSKTATASFPTYDGDDGEAAAAVYEAAEENHGVHSSRHRPDGFLTPGECVRAGRHSQKDYHMAYSESLACRVRATFAGWRGITEKKMFGGVGFMLHGNMCVGVWQTSLIVRLGPEQAAMALKEPNVFEFDVTGRPMKGWIMVEAEGMETDEQLRGWIKRAVEFVETLPKK